MIKNLIIFLKKPSEYASEIENINISFFISIIIAGIILKATFDLISPHDFPPEFSYQTAQIISPNILEYLASSLLLLFINLFIFIPVMLFNIEKQGYFFKFILLNITLLLIISIPLILKGYYIYFVILTPVFLWYFINRNNKAKYLLLIKIFISSQIIYIISEPFMFVSEIIKNEFLFTLFNILFAIIYLTYFIKLIKSKFDLSINNIIFYSIFSFAFSFIYGFIIYRSNLFNSNIIKLLLY